jgi:hypothetical protein
MAGEIEAYLQAREAFIAADKAVTEYQQRLLFIVRNLNEKERGRFWIHGVPFSLPVGALANARSPSIIASEFPTAEQAAAVLSAWHEARHAVMDAQRAVPAQYRSSVPGLPAGVAATPSDSRS